MSDHDPWSKKSISAGLFVQIVGGVIAAVLVAYFIGGFGSGGASGNTTAPPVSSDTGFLASQMNIIARMYTRTAGRVLLAGFLAAFMGIMFNFIAKFKGEEQSVGPFFQWLGLIMMFVGAIWYYLQYGSLSS